ncbi:hypothetical protein GCM10027614_61980 [Micromonospora vulcania]
MGGQQIVELRDDRGTLVGEGGDGEGEIEAQVHHGGGRHQQPGEPATAGGVQQGERDVGVVGGAEQVRVRPLAPVVAAGEGDPVVGDDGQAGIDDPQAARQGVVGRLGVGGGATRRG